MEEHEFEIVERTEPFTIEEVFDFIDDTSIGKMDAHELKSRIANMTQEVRAKAIDEFAEKIHNEFHDYRIDGKPVDYWLDRLVDKIAQQLKAGGKDGK